MATFEDRDRGSVKRDDPKDKDRKNPGSKEGEESKDKYSRQSQGTPGEGSDRQREHGQTDEGIGSRHNPKETSKTDEEEEA